MDALEELEQQRREIDRRIAEAKKRQAEEQRRSKARGNVVRDIAAKVVQYQIELPELEDAVKALVASGGVQVAQAAKARPRAKPGAKQATSPKPGKATKAAKSAVKRAKAVLAPKYRDPNSGKTWSGRGLQPLWFRDALNSGKRPEELEIKAGKGRVA